MLGQEVKTAEAEAKKAADAGVTETKKADAAEASAAAEVKTAKAKAKKAADAKVTETKKASDVYIKEGKDRTIPSIGRLQGRRRSSRRRQRQSRRRKTRTTRTPQTWTSQTT